MAQGTDWVAIYGAVLATITAGAQGARAVTRRRPAVRVEAVQSEYAVHEHGSVPHLKMTAVNVGATPVQVIRWTLEDTPPWHTRVVISRWGHRLERLGVPGPWRRTGMINFFSTFGEATPLPRNVLPLVLAPNEHADWYFPISGERAFITEKADGNPDHLRVRIHLADGRSVAGAWFRLNEA